MTTDDSSNLARDLARIRKCLALGASSNAHEAAAALRQAQALMRRHDLTEADVELPEIVQDTVKTREGFGACTFLVELGSLLRDAFGVTSILSGNPGTANRANVIYVGPVGRPQMAAWAHKVITRAVDDAWAEHLRHFPHHKSVGGKRTAFRIGWLYSVRSKVQAVGFTEKETQAIGRWKRLRYGENGLGSTVTPRLKLDEEGLRVARRGAQAASSFSLHRPVDGSTAPADPLKPDAPRIGVDP